jgi:ATPase family associated with various cellular activities (AAA)
MMTPPPIETITTAELLEVLLDRSVDSPVYVWGPTGVGKSCLVEAFAAAAGAECLTLLCPQLTLTDLVDVPETVEDGDERVSGSGFAWPEQGGGARSIVLFLDDLNVSSAEVREALSTLALGGRLGSFELPTGSVVVAAGVASLDEKAVESIGTAVTDGFVHLHLSVSAPAWLDWAAGFGVHKWVLDYVRHRPGHLWVPPPATGRASTPRSWHALSDALLTSGATTAGEALTLARGCVCPEHAGSFGAFVKARLHSYDLDALLEGDLSLPDARDDRDVLYFLAVSLHARLVEALPLRKRSCSRAVKDLVTRTETALSQLSRLSLGAAETVIFGESDVDPALPDWFIEDATWWIEGLHSSQAE